MSADPVDPGRPPKTIHVVRHGQSLANARAIPDAPNSQDIRYVDAPLTPLGVSQADALSDFVAGVKPDLIISSPMTRALQTCLHATSKLAPDPGSILVTPMCTERVAYACDIGSPVEVVRQRFPQLDLGGVPPSPWWWHAKGHESVAEAVQGFVEGRTESDERVHARCGEFLKFIEGREEKNVVVFAHGVFLRRFVEFVTKEPHAGFDNCEVRKVVI